MLTHTTNLLAVLHVVVVVCSAWGWRLMFAANWFIIVSTLVAGLGFGGYASVTGLVRSINQYRCGHL